LAPEARVSVILRATREEKLGAEMRVGGIRVIERNLHQLGRTPDVRATVVSDGNIRLPELLPANVEVRTTQDAAALVQQLQGQQGQTNQPVVVGADVVRLQASRFDGTRVVDEASRAAAEDAVFNDLLRGDLGLIARVINKKISFRLTRHVLCHLPLTPNMVTLMAGAIGLLGALLISMGSYASVVAGFLLAQVQSILDGCDGELARVRFQQTAIGEWLDTIVDDFLNLALTLAIGVALWRQGGTFLGLKTALAAAGMLLFYNVVAYRELIKQGEGGEVLKIRWWFASGQNIKSIAGAGGGPMNALLAIGKRDFFIFAWLVLACFNLLPIVMLYALVLAIIYAGVAVGQVMTAASRVRPPV
jgi:phosphatidylglycerophosphate synthase